MDNKKIKVSNRLSSLLVLVCVVSACSTVTIRPNGGAKDTSVADYIDSKPFFLGGPIGEHQVNVNDACEGNEVTQMQTVTTSSDWFLSLITLGIYTPRTAKVWCEEAL